jgi:hypothetical protein
MTKIKVVLLKFTFLFWQNFPQKIYRYSVSKIFFYTLKVRSHGNIDTVEFFYKTSFFSDFMKNWLVLFLRNILPYIRNHQEIYMLMIIKL